MKQEFVCSLCGHVKSVEEDYLDLSIHLPEAPEKKDVIPLNKAMAEFMGQEEIEWTCPGCHKKGTAVMKHALSRLPRTLVLHLKRFDAVGKKLVTPVALPLTLNLAPYAVGTSGPTTYSLKALVVHIGSTIRSGHYICFSKRCQDERWCRYNDSRVDFVDVNVALRETNNAYILCYVQDKL